MKILLINKYYFLKGGAERHLFVLQEQLERAGHEIAVFAMEHPENRPSPWSKYFVSNVEFDTLRGGNQGLRTAGRMLYSFEARKKLQQLLKVFKPDIAHVHNIYHQISPSILPLLRKNGIPVVQTLHDYKLICPNYSLYTEGDVCERCKKHNYVNAIRHKCLKHSVVASTLAATEMSLHKLLGLYERNVNIFISPSAFLKDKVRSWGYTNLDIRHLPYSMEPLDVAAPVGTYLLYFGRLSQEKGVDTLLAAMRTVKTPLTIAGTGPQEQELKDYAKEHNLDHVHFVGFQSGTALDGLIRNSMGVVVPSRWHENYPFAILESFAAGKAVLGTRRGGIPELVVDGKRGILTAAGSAEELADAIRRFTANSNDLEQWGNNAQTFLASHRFSALYPQLMKIYEDARA